MTGGGPCSIPGLGFGARIDRYIIRERVGSGGMGTVFAAHDPELDREVAIKVVHTRADAPQRQAFENVMRGLFGAASKHETSRSPAEDRLMREAQAAASISHPNVVTIHNVGRSEFGVFIAMEFIAGRTFREWLLDEPRPPTLVLETLLAAGRGLAAAHARGIVHRDFKPDNVMVADDGRILVVDFGLAHANLPHVSHASDNAMPGIATRTLTREGSVMGTPAYMSPEQSHGYATDHRTDQFSFCATLWEALVGRRPFARAVPDLLQHPLRFPGDRKRLPYWRYAVLRRGMAIDPGDRYPSMSELLEALAGSGRRPRKRVLGLGAAGLIVGLGAVAATWPSDPPCQARELEAAALWTRDGRGRIEDALGATGDPTLAPRALAKIDGFAAAVVELTHSSCLAAQTASREQLTVVDARNACIQTARARLGSAIDSLARVAPDESGLAREILLGLGDLEGCRETDAAHLGPPRPTDPRLAAHVDSLRAQRAGLDSILETRRVGLGDSRIERLLADMDESGYGPLQAEARAIRGRLLSHAGRWSEAATENAAGYYLAVEHGHDEMAYETAVALLRLYGGPMLEPPEAERWEARARALLQRLGDPPSRRARYEEARGLFADARGDVASAVAHYERALAAWSEVPDPPPRLFASLLHNQATALAAHGRLDEALATRSRAIELLKTTLGDGHPLTGAASYAYGSDLERAGRLVEARVELSRALATFRMHFAPDHPWIVKALNELGLLDRISGSPALARAEFTEALGLVAEESGSNVIS